MTQSIAQPQRSPIPVTLLGTCPGCSAEIAPRVQLALESIRSAAKRPVTPELIVLCRQCQRPFVVSLQPMPEPGR